MSWLFKKKDKDKKDSEQKDTAGDISPREEPSKSKPKALDPKKIDHLVQKLKAEWEHYIDAKTDKDRRSRLISVASLFLRLYDVKKLEFRQIKQGLSPSEFVAALVPKLTAELNANRSGLPRVLSSAPSPLAVALNHVIIEENDALRGVLGLGALAEEIAVALQSVLDLSTTSSTQKEKALDLTGPHSAVDVLVNLLLSLCSHEEAMDEFVRYDALDHVLSLPFHALHSSPHLTAASLKLLLASRDRLLSGVNTLFKYLHVDAVNHLVKKQWLATVLATLSDPSSMPAEHIVDMSSTIFKCLKESTRCSSAALLDQFKELQGYAVTLKLLLHFDHAHIPKTVMKQFLDQITDLVFVGTRVLSSKLSSPKLQLTPVLTKTLSRRDSSMLMTATREIKNLDAFKLFHDYFLKSVHDEFKHYALECVTQIYASHPNNFRIVEEFHLLSHLLQAAASSSPSVRDAIMNLLVFVVTSGINCVAYQELVGLSCLLQEHPVVEVCRSVQNTVQRLIAFDAQFADTMTDAGMLQVLITLMTRMDKQIKSLTAKNDRKQMKLISSERPMTYDEMSTVLHTLALVLEHSSRNRELFRHSRSVVELFSLLNFAETRNGSLAVSAALIRDDNQNAEGETKALIEYFNQLQEIDARYHVLQALHTILRSTYCTKDWFRAYGGFKGVEVSLAQLQGKLTDDTSRDHAAMMQYLLVILQCTGAAIHNHQENILYLREDVKYDTIERAIVQSGVLTSSDLHALTALHALITLACHGRVASEQHSMLEQPEVITLALRCAFKCSQHTRESFLHTLTQLAQQSRVNCAVMAQAGVISLLLAQHGAAVPAAVLELIEILAKVSIAVTELAQLVRLVSFDNTEHALTRALLRICHTARSPSCVSLSNAVEGWSCLELLITDRSWPVATAAGYTLMFWFCIESYASADNHLDALFRLIPEDKKNIICLSLKQGKLFLHTTAKEFVDVKTVLFTPGQWYHLTLVHEKNRFAPSSSEIKFYVDGVLRATETLSYPAAVSNRFTIEFGTSKSNALGPSNQLWLLGPSYMLDGTIDAREAHMIAALGPSYHGNFQGPLDMYQTYSAINAKSLSLVSELAGGTRPQTPLGHLDLSKSRLNITEDRIVFMLSAFNVKYLMQNSDELSLSTEDLMEEHYVAWTARRERSEPNYQHWAVIRGPRRRAINSPQSLNNSRSSSAVTSPRASRMGSVINSITALGALGALEAGDVFANQLALALGGARLVHSMPVVSLFACVAGHRLLLHYLECVDHPQSGASVLSAEECTEHLNLLLALFGELVSGPASSVNILLFERFKVYPLLEYILSYKGYLFNADTVMLLFDLLCATRSTGPKYFSTHSTSSNKTDLNAATIANPFILRTVMMNYDVWRASRVEIRIKWLKHLAELLSGNFHKEFNLWRMRKSHALSALLYMLNDDTLDEALLSGVVDLISHLVHGTAGLDDLRALAAYIVATLPQTGPGAPVKTKLKTRATTVRNMLLSIVLDVLMGQKCTESHVKIFDPQWTFLFIDFHLDVTTVTLALKIACTLFIDSPHFATKFRAMHGFAVLQRILPSFSYCVDVYYIAFCFVYNKPLHALPALPSDFLALFDLFKDAAVSQSKEMFSVVFAMLKKSFERSLSTERISISESELQLVNKRASMIRTSSDHHVIKPTGPASWKGGSGGSLLTQSIFVSCGVVDMLSGRPHRVTVVSNNAMATKTNQKTLVLFLRHLFNTNKKELFDMLMTRDDTLNDLVDMLFPTGALNLPQNTSSEDECASDQNVLESDQQIESGHLVFDLLSYIVTTALLDQNLVLLERVVELAPPVNISDRDYVRYMSKLLTDAIKHFLVTVHKADVVANKYELFSVLARFASYVVDKIAMDLFPSGTSHVFDLLVHLLELFNVDKAPAIDPRFEVTSLFKSLNRTILLMLKSSDQLIDALNKLLYHQRVVLSPLNNDTEFFFNFSQLTYRMMLHDSDELKLTVMNIWKLLIFTKPEVMDSLLLYKTSKGEVIDLKTKGFMLLLSADPAEFMTWLNHNIKTVNVIFEELLAKTNTAPSSELKVRTDKLKALKSRRSAKASKQQKSEASTMTKFQKVRVNRRTMIARVSEEENQRLKTIKNNRADRERWIAKIWNDMRRPMYMPNRNKDVSLNKLHHTDKPRGSEDEEIKLQELTQEITAKVLDKWQLDFTEGPRRMRRKLEMNTQFFESYPYSPDYDPDVNHHLATEQELILYPTKKPLSHDSKEYFYGYKDAVDKSLEYLHRVQEEMTKRRAAPPLTLALTTTATSSERDTVPATARSPEERRALAHVHEAFEGRGGTDESETPPSSSPLNIKPVRKISSASGDSEDSDDTSTSATPSSVPHSPAMRSEVVPNTLAAYLQSLLTGEDVESDESATDEQSELTEGSDEDWPSETDPNSELGEDELDQDVFGEDEDDEDANQLILRRHLELGDAAVAMYNCGRIEGLDKYDGLLIFGEINVYFIDHYSLTPEGDIIDVSAQSKRATPFINYTSTWAHEDIKAVMKRRYLLRPVALELFASDGRNCLLVFDLKDRDPLYERFLALIKQVRDGQQQSLAAMIGLNNPTAATTELQEVELSFTPLENLHLPLKVMTHKWVQGEISNFHYLIYLNTLAGRSYNDLTQYPVFPWVLNTYDTASIDLHDAAVYRALDKPMGALDNERADKFQQKYEVLEQTLHETASEHSADDPEHMAPYHYGSHYSSSGTVLHYLIRLEPFTRQFIQFQGGRFDHPDRLFHSISESWQSASAKNMMDVKELIPEFFYLSDFLLNTNRFIFGKRQDGAVVNHVVLPAWAKNSPRYFVHLHRRALESEHVSNQLHLWIDLIFGVKQRGNEAVQALNVFHPLTYEGTVDVDRIDDPIKRRAIIDQINHFGQTPAQLFTKAHPKRAARTELRGLFDTSSTPVAVNVKSLAQAVGEMRVVHDKLIALELKKRVLQAVNNSIKWVTWGYEDYTVRVWENDKLLQIIDRGAWDQIQHVATSIDGKYLALAGGRDCVLSIYRLRMRNVWRQAEETTEEPALTPTTKKKKRGLALGLTALRLIAQPQLLMHKDSFEWWTNLLAHQAPITAVDISRRWSIIASGDQNGKLCVWDLNKRFNAVVWQRDTSLGPHYLGDEPTSRGVNLISVNAVTGDIVTCFSTWFNLWTINGDLILAHNTSNSPAQQITSVSWMPGATQTDEIYAVVTGHRDGTIKVWKFNHLDKEQRPNPNMVMLAQLQQHRSAITSLCVSERRILSGDHVGQIYAWFTKDDAEEFIKKKKLI